MLLRFSRCARAFFDESATGRDRGTWPSCYEVTLIVLTVCLNVIIAVPPRCVSIMQFNQRVTTRSRMGAVNSEREGSSAF